MELFRNELFITGPSNNWLAGMFHRYPTLTLRKPEELSKASANVSSLNLDIWFQNLINYLDRKHLLKQFQDDPGKTTNMDETGVGLNEMPKKIFTSKRVPHTYKVSNAKEKQCITVTIAVAADGHLFSPQIIFRKSFTRLSDCAFAAGCNDFFLLSLNKN